MPFLLGSDAVRRTIPYLKKGRLILKNCVKVMAIHFNSKGDFNQGAKDFVYWNLCQVQYKNPEVQVIFVKDRFPSPFIRCWLDNGEDVIMDVFNKSNVEIMDHLVKTLGQPDVKDAEEKQETLDNICKFGSGYERHCMCEIPGQVPCPCLVRLPEHMTGKYMMENSLHPPRGTTRL